MLPEVSTGPILPGDRYLPCTDGPTRERSDEKIAEAVGSTDDLARVGRELIEAANAAGGKDNVTVVVAAAN